MSITVLFSDERSWIAAERRVYRASERERFADAATQGARLATLVRDREAALAAERSDAREEGLERGRAAGRAQIAAELAEALAALSAGIDAERDRRRAETVELALAVVRRVLVDVAPAARLAALARTAVAELDESPRRVLLVHPERLDAVRSALADAPGAFEAILAEPALGPDGASIETGGGRIAIDLETQLAAIGERLAAFAADALGASEPRS